MLVVVFIATLLVIFFIQLIMKYRRLPPGPYGIPFIGYYPFLGENPPETIANLSKKYGDIISMTLMGDTYWFINSIDAIDEAFVKNGELFSGRAYSNEYNVYSLLSSNCHGVLEGKDYKLSHRITVGKYALLGMGKSDYENKMHELFEKVEEYVDSMEGKPNDYHEILMNFSSNIMTNLVLSKVYNYDDPEYLKISHWNHSIFNSFAYMNFTMSGFGFKLLMTYNPKYVKIIEENRDEFREFVDKIINERMEKFDPNNCKDVLDYFIKEKDGPNGHLFHRKAISGRIMESLLGGTHSTAATLYHSLRFMSLHPEIQEKVFNEINDIFGTNNLIYLTDKPRLPYTNAVISEILRYTCLLPLVPTHVNYEAINLWGYHVPKRTKVVPNFYAVSRSPKYFKNPNEFDPNNFLDENENYVPNRALIPFFTGFRKCLGIKLAETEVFIGFARLMQRFKWIQAEDECVAEVDVADGLIRDLKPNKVIGIRRAKIEEKFQ